MSSYAKSNKMRAKKTLLSMFAVGLGGTALWWSGGDESNQSSAHADDFANQLWIDRNPKDSRDMVDFLVAIESREGRAGAAGRASQWRQHTDIFRWAQEGDRLLTLWPQDRVKARFEIRTWECKGEAPAPFDLCLSIAHGKRTRNFYSRQEWKVRPHSDEAMEAFRNKFADDPVIGVLVHELPHKFPSFSADDSASGEKDRDERKGAGSEANRFDSADSNWMPF